MLGTKPDAYNSPFPRRHVCLICGKLVPDEMFEVKRPDGLTVRWYSPQSRYWAAAGVLCSPECSMLHYHPRTPSHRD